MCSTILRLTDTPAQPVSATIARQIEEDLDASPAEGLRTRPGMNNARLLVASFRSFARATVPDYARRTPTTTVAPTLSSAPQKILKTDLVTGVVIAMPDPAKPRYSQPRDSEGWLDGQLPRVALGWVERPWKVDS